ncbi:pyeidoxamine 5'-phosphate oxidase-related putative heme iron utilization protein [Vibrio ishigakensis]|uniref:Pyeidoxamine 5'-phosphate oxidase-related putative heme iron utilization protein n=1 Tax=Vibrio ishigakensis TaxID=1481914 RepID=A0A0B8PEZ8_9VIBR|nr:pyeidoxamine 5'-phosphate oxidase-related putative heme iron utilization protein [Vibrio ishigakensis]
MTAQNTEKSRDEIKQERLQGRLGPEVQEFRDACQTLQLATITKDGLPHVSYAPFAFDKAGYYILVSDLAAHGQNLKTTKNVSIMMVEDESQAKSVHARKRLTFDTTAQHIDKETEEGKAGVSALVERFGEMAQNLANLGDFNLYKLTPSSGRYVKGFGQAFNVSGNDLVDFLHLNEGHVQDEKNKLAELATEQD